MKASLLILNALKCEMKRTSYRSCQLSLKMQDCRVLELHSKIDSMMQAEGGPEFLNCPELKFIFDVNAFVCIESEIKSSTKNTHDLP